MKGLKYKDFANKVRNTNEGVGETDYIIDALSANDTEKVGALQWDASLADIAQTLIKSIQVKEGTKIATSVFGDLDLEEYDINPRSIFGEFAEEGSEVGFEALTRMTFDDHDNEHSLRFKYFKYIGVAHEKKVSGYSSITYIILADNRLYDKSRDADQQSIGLNSAQKTNLQRYNRGVPKPNERSDTQHTIIGDKNYNDSTAPVLNTYDNPFFDEIVPSRKEENIVNMKSYIDLESNHRPVHAVGPNLSSVEDKVAGWKRHNLDKNEILENSDIKPPSYFNIHNLKL
jgi:hypothetical protein